MYLFSSYKGEVSCLTGT